VTITRVYKVDLTAEEILAACGLDRNQLGRLGKSLRHVVLRG